MAATMLFTSLTEGFAVAVERWKMDIVTLLPKRILRLILLLGGRCKPRAGKHETT
jgi:hypothetical protein